MDPCTKAQAEPVADGADDPVTTSEVIAPANTPAVPLSDADLNHVAGGSGPNAAQGAAWMRKSRGA